jgi:hypothetical protein
VPSALIEWMYVLLSSNSLALDSPFTVTIVTISPVLWSSPCTVIITLNISFFSVPKELVVCASKSGKVIGTVVAINPSNDADRNAKISLFCLIAVDKRLFFNDQ